MKNQLINKHIKQLDYIEYAGKNKFGKNYIDLQNGNSNDLHINNIFRSVDLRNLFLYEYSQNKDLIKFIAKNENILPENILLTAGADSALHHTAETFLGINKKSFIPIPSFPRYEFHTKVVGAKPVFLNLFGKNEIERLEFIKTQLNQKKINLLFIASPNNPTGESFHYKNMNNFLSEINKTIVVIDQALAGYFNDSLSPLALKFSNVIIIKSFSKLYNLPGLRIGYIIASVSIIKFIKKTISPYELSTPSIEIAKSYLKNPFNIAFRKKEVCDSIEYIKKNLKLNFSLTEGPFILIDGDKKIPFLYKKLLDNNILTVNGKNFRGLEKNNTVRVILTDYQSIKKLVKIINFLIN